MLYVLQVKVLKLLESRSLQHTPRVISDGVHALLGPYIVMTPCGRHLKSSDTPALIAQAVLDVAKTMHAAASGPAQEQVLHRDVSASSIVVDAEGRGVLLNFQLARIGPAGGSSHTVALNPVFGAISVPWHSANTVSSDLESLYYSLLHVVTDGKVRVPLARRPHQDEFPWAPEIFLAQCAMCSLVVAPLYHLHLPSCLPHMTGAGAHIL